MESIKSSIMQAKHKINHNEAGFTLIEILVVILIIGILASIAIPVFVNQRKTANDAAAVSDVRNANIVLETYIANNPEATTFDSVWLKANTKESPSSGVSVYGTPNDYCMTGVHNNGKKYVNGMGLGLHNGARAYYLYSNLKGGYVTDVSIELTNLSCYHSPIHI